MISNARIDLTIAELEEYLNTGKLPEKTKPPVPSYTENPPETSGYDEYHQMYSNGIYTFDLANDGKFIYIGVDTNSEFYRKGTYKFIDNTIELHFIHEGETEEITTCKLTNDRFIYKDSEYIKASLSNDNNSNNNDDIIHPGKNLEFVIGANVENVDFSKYQEKCGTIGGVQYYGLEYVPAIDDYGQQIDPEHCVIYTVTHCPVFSSKELHITEISITDPEVSIYGGITLNTSFDDFTDCIRNFGYEITFKDERGCTAQKGNIWISFTHECITIGIYITNNQEFIY